MSSGARAADFERRFREACAAGNPPDRLRRYSRDETERFYAHVVQGPDGHCYWTGSEAFRRNDGRTQVPRRWVWEQAHGELARYGTVVKSTCREPNCVALAHLVRGKWEPGRRYSDEALLRYLQVGKLRLGRRPTIKLWKSSGYRPVWEIFRDRFGSWNEALRRAGL